MLTLIYLLIICFQVVLAVARAFYYLALPSESKKVLPPLLRLLHVSPEVERVVLTYLLIISRTLSVCLYVGGFRSLRVF